MKNTIGSMPFWKLNDRYSMLDVHLPMLFLLMTIALLLVNTVTACARQNGFGGEVAFSDFV